MLICSHILSGCSYTAKAEFGQRPDGQQNVKYLLPGLTGKVCPRLISMKTVLPCLAASGFFYILHIWLHCFVSYMLTQRVGQNSGFMTKWNENKLLHEVCQGQGFSLKSCFFFFSTMFFLPLVWNPEILLISFTPAHVFWMQTWTRH